MTQAIVNGAAKRRALLPWFSVQDEVARARRSRGRLSAFMRVAVLLAVTFSACVVELADPSGALCDERGCPSGLECRGFRCVTPVAGSVCETPPGLEVVWSQCAEGVRDGGRGPLERAATGPVELPGLEAAAPPLPLRAMTLSGRITLSGTLADQPLPLIRLVEGVTPLVELVAQRGTGGVRWAHAAQQGLVGPTETSLLTGAVTTLGRAVTVSLRLEPGRLVQLDVDGQPASQTLGSASTRPTTGPLRLLIGPFQVGTGTTVVTRLEGFELSWSAASDER